MLGPPTIAVTYNSSIKGGSKKKLGPKKNQGNLRKKTPLWNLIAKLGNILSI